MVTFAIIVPKLGFFVKDGISDCNVALSMAIQLKLDKTWPQGHFRAPKSLSCEIKFNLKGIFGLK